MEDGCWSIFALENVNSLAASIALKGAKRKAPRMGLGAFEFHHVGAYPSGRHFELSVGISYKASNARSRVSLGSVRF